MEKIDKFELMLMDSPINILGLPDGAVEQIIELMNKCYTIRNDEVVAILKGRLKYVSLSTDAKEELTYLITLLTNPK